MLLLLFPRRCYFLCYKEILWLFSRIVSAIEYIWFGQWKIYWQSSNRIWSHFGVHDFSVVYFVSFVGKNVTFYSIVIWLENQNLWAPAIFDENRECKLSVGLHYNLWIERYVLVGINDSNRNVEFWALLSTSNGSTFNRKNSFVKAFHTVTRYRICNMHNFLKNSRPFLRCCLHS